MFQYTPHIPAPNAASYAMYRHQNTAIRGSNVTPIAWVHDGKFVTYDVATNSRGGRFGQLSYPGAGSGWGMYYMPSPLDYFVVSPDGMDGNITASCHNLHHNLIPRLVWNEVFLKGITGFMMVHAYTKYKDDDGVEQYRYASKELEGEDIIEDGTDICGGVFLGCQSLSTIEENIPNFEELQKEAFGNTELSNISNKVLITSTNPATIASEGAISSAMDAAVHDGKRIDDIIKDGNLFKNWGFIYVINNGSVMIRGRHQGDENIEDGPFMRFDGPSKKLLLHGASNESKEAKYCKNIQIESSGSDYDIIYFDEETNQITIKALKKLYLRTFQDDITIRSDADVVVQSKNIKLISTANIDICAGGNVNIGAGGFVSINGAQILMNSSGKLVVSTKMLSYGGNCIGMAGEWASSVGSLTSGNITSYLTDTIGMIPNVASFTNASNLMSVVSGAMGNASAALSALTGSAMSGIPVSSGFGNLISSFASSISSFNGAVNQFTSFITETMGSVLTPITQMTNYANNIVSGFNTLTSNYTQISNYVKPREYTKVVQTQMNSTVNMIDTNVTNLYDSIIT